MSTVKSIEERTRPNLKLTLKDLNIENGQELMVADQTNPNTVTIKIKYTKSVWKELRKCYNLRNTFVFLIAFFSFLNY